ncbi:ABC transporter ATP-binding protein [Clostridium formicaceticum]|uniref:Oligopeptide transport ATP-binding protein OppF n=1 Tax=Clostridium formicaceticum TaxID=1497 RepID=A0AAC9RKW2_9CLOT|nr:dipeptide/oligopeptide/nickel ABC transporter ATP-binding protein [Clostridium formicaceticum]AOY77032.1 peptide ABC transporter ATP-binding protein [Clostridium formicaceticum]ARE87532.1 Oligopeptide transport ATP-binding protein OppF [Clostridium formicaceticum]
MLLEVKNIYKTYKRPFGMLKKERFEVLKDVSLFLYEGECLGIIGESGSGKSTLGRLMIGVEKADGGSIRIDGKEISKKADKSIKEKVSVVFQDYSSSVNPRLKIIDILWEPIKVFEGLSQKESLHKIITLLEKVGLSKEYLYRYPHQLSGGQLQRVCIARAIATSPKFILLDEAISSLDVSIQVQILDLLIQLKEEMRISYIFITHDLTAVTYICDRVVFLKEGRIIEEVDDMKQLKNVKEPYSKALLYAARAMNAREESYEIQRIS